MKKPEYTALNFWIKESYTNYSMYTSFRRCTVYDVLQEAMDGKARAVISTRLPSIFVKKHLLAIDCDSKTDADRAENHLKEICNTERIESSPGRFWIIADYVA